MLRHLASFRPRPFPGLVTQGLVLPGALLLAAFALLFWLVFGGPSSAGEQSRTMSPTEIQTSLVGKLMEWKALDGSLGVFGRIIFKDGGDVVMTTNLPGLPQDQGQWWLEDNQICTRWSAARDGSPKCYRVINQGAGRFMTTGGNQFELVGDPMV